MSYNRKRLVSIAKTFEENKPLTPEEIHYLLTFEKISKDGKIVSALKKVAIPASLVFGFFFSAFPQQFAELAQSLPKWTNFTPPVLVGVDYLWDFLGEPVKKANIIYHIPNIIIYSFGFFGIKKLMDAIDRRTWLDHVYAAKKNLFEKITNGVQPFQMRPGHSLLFVGKGDFIGMQFAHNHDVDETVTIAENKPYYTQFWSQYNTDGLYDDLKLTITRAGGKNAGEYVFFPVKDDQIFLPNETAYDLSPHKLDILCQNIRVIERELGWENKRIIIIGDRFHRSFVQSEDQRKVIPKSEDIISLGSIAKRYKNVTLLDPSDIVLQQVLKIAQGRKIVFRATMNGIAEYKERFYNRLEELGYKPTKKGILTIGYDIFEDQTEQQTLAHTINDYYPVVLSKNVRDALLRNGYKEDEFLYVPQIVLETLNVTAAEQ